MLEKSVHEFLLLGMNSQQFKELVLVRKNVLVLK